ncbi:hypothetical protein BO70DRAFT_366818 [Aspergillus heteromorphus CBS 117.55]|uniref:Uncharacterized protein n=1 Tax=Aspergillus heteromorphus CBS 117.55 TaxID=1448321 RepID=A0A317UZ15_9EURO|nr:uncharacterized protein BO70DRAFT_366818 [Aspergillus heteromorphus CBS 117.55]PWY65240.1 hypothetical protein BO70DRAFT_366818 [Aspergillus heteromorphus CBS 117.55]
MLKELASISRLAQRSRPIHTSSVLTLTQPRPFHTLPALQTTHDQSSEAKSGDRTVLDPQRSEVSKSGTDNEVAGHPAAYDPSKTSPESEIEATQEETRREGKVSNPLDMSPANKDVSHWRHPTEGGPDHNAEKSGPSSRGWTKKNRPVGEKAGKN